MEIFSKNKKFLDRQFYDINFINEESVYLYRIDIIIERDEIEFIRRKKVLLLKEEMRNASSGYSTWGPTNQFRSTFFSSSLSLANISPQREEWKLKQMKSWSLLQGGTNLSKKIQVKGPLRRNRTLSN